MLTREQAIEEISAECDAGTWPEITADLDRLLDRHAIVDGAENPPANDDAALDWAAATVITYGTVVKVSERWWRCTKPGTTGATAPTWPELDGNLIDVTRSVADGTVRWSDNGSRWAPTWHLAAAIAAGWRTKAAKVAGDHTFAEDGQQFDKNAVHRHCLRMADQWRGKTLSTYQIEV